MSARSAFHFRSTFAVIKAQEPEDMSSRIADDLQACVRIPATPILPGETVAAQMRRSWERLGRPKWWRLKAAWYGEAGSFSAAAAQDIQHRFVAWREADARRAASSAELERVRQGALRRETLERSRADIAAQLAKIEAQLALVGHHGGDPA